MGTVRFARLPSPLGPIWVAETDAGVAACSRVEALDAFLAPLARRFPGASVVAADVDGGWLSERQAVPPIDLTGVPRFDAQVYRIVRDIPPGETLTYGDVARLAGSPGAARAVGGAMRRCPLFPAVPCHRVVRAADGWSGWGGDPALKRRLLMAERRAAR